MNYNKNIVVSHPDDLCSAEITRYLDDLIQDLRYEVSKKSEWFWNPKKCIIIMNKCMFNKFLSLNTEYVYDCEGMILYHGIRVECDDRLNPDAPGQKRAKYYTQETVDDYYIPRMMGLEATRAYIDKDMQSLKKCYNDYIKNRIDKVIFNSPATIVFWGDGTKTVVKAQEGDGWDMEKGLAMAIVKHMMGLKDFYKAYNDAVDKYLKPYR